MKKLENFEPAQFLRMDCYRHALIPVVRHFNKPWEIFLLFPITHFSYSERIDCNELGKSKVNNMLADIGIRRVFTPVNRDNFISSVCNEIDEGHPVIAFIDSFYNPSFPSIYGKFHSRHCIPIYGYDEERKEFNIVDSDYIEDFTRIHKTISFDAAKEAFFSYNEQFEKGTTPFLQVFSLTSAMNSNPYKKYFNWFKQIILSEEDPLEKYHTEFKNFSEFFEKSYADESLMKAQITILYGAFNKMLNAKHVEYTIFGYMFDENCELQKIIDKQIDKFNYVRAIFFKTQRSGRYREASFAKCSEVIKEIIEIERAYIDTLKCCLISVGDRGNTDEK